MELDESLKVLIVDDMPAMRSVIRSMLEEMGLRRIIDADSAEAAWDLLVRSASTPNEYFSLVVSDWLMPGMTGLELLRSVRTYDPTRDLPFMMVTSQGEPVRLLEAMDAGVTDFLVKPFDQAELARRIRRIFGAEGA